jgi:hypothetical protein
MARRALSLGNVLVRPKVAAFVILENLGGLF